MQAAAQRQRFWTRAIEASATPLRTYLVAMILVATVPIALLMTYHILSGVKAEQQRLQLRLQRSATWLAHSVEQELGSYIEALTLLSYTDAITHRDPIALSWLVQARPSVARAWSSLYVISADGKLVFDSSSRPLADSLSLQRVRRVLSDGKPLVSQLDLEDGMPAVTVVDVPVVGAGAARYVIGARIKSQVWQRLIDEARERDADIVAMFDRRLQPIAHAQALPRPAEPAARAASAPLLPVTPVSFAPEHTVAAWGEVPLAGWSVAVGVQMAPVVQAQSKALVTALAIAGGCLLVGVSLALVLARRVTTPLQRLAAGERARLSNPSGIREIDGLSAALSQAEQQNDQAKESLQRNADEFETLFNSSPVALAFAQDPACTQVLHNVAMRTLLGQGAGSGLITVKHRGQRLDAEQQPLQRAARLGEGISAMELELLVDAQPPIHVLAHAVPLRDAAGLPRGAIGAMVDITERKLAEARLLSADQRLHDKQHLIDLAQEAGRVGFFHYRFDHDVLAWTPGQAKLFGLESTQWESTLSDWEQRIDPSDRAGVEHALRDLLDQQRDKATLEFRVLVGSAAPRWLSTRVVISYDEDRRPLQLIGVTMDISDQKEAERERAAWTQREQAAREEAEAANRAKDEFLAMLSHELRNPLSAIASAVEVLNRTEAGMEVAVRARRIIARQTRHLAHMVDDLLDVTRVISGKVLLSRTRIELSALVKRAATTLDVTGATAQHHMTLQLQEVWIDADVTRMEQVVNNLLNNALKFTPTGGSIDVEVRAEAGEAVLVVRDTGVGIAPEVLPRIFDLFVQGERTLDRRAGGLGIGLTLVRRLLELQGGRITASSTSAGSVFEARLPATAQTEAAQPPLGLAVCSGRRIALIEDNGDALAAMQSMLELEGHSVLTASDGISGLQALLGAQPDVAVIDIGLPGLTGFEVARQSRAAGYRGRMIALSGYGLERDIGQALAAGFDAHLVKPLDANQLRRLLADDPQAGRQQDAM